MRFNRRLLSGVSLGASIIAASGASASGPIPFESGTFLSDDMEVFQGIFSQSLKLDTLSLGEATFRVDRNELVRPSSIRVYVDVDRDGNYELLSDEQLQAGKSPVGFAFGRDMEISEGSTSIEVASSLDFARMLYTDGTVPVRVDVLLSIPLYDNEGELADNMPEAIVAGSLDINGIALTAIVAGNLDEPITARRTLKINQDSIASGETGIVMLMTRPLIPQRIGIVGADLSEDLGLRPGLTALGYRLEVNPGNEGVFAVLGSADEAQLLLGMEEPIIEIENLASAGELGGGGGGGSMGGAGNLPGISRSFRRFSIYRRNLPFRGSASGSENNDFGNFRFIPDPIDEPDDDGIKERRRRRDDGDSGDDDDDSFSDDPPDNGDVPVIPGDPKMNDNPPDRRDGTPRFPKDNQRRGGGQDDIFHSLIGGGADGDETVLTALADLFESNRSASRNRNGITLDNGDHNAVPTPGALGIVLMTGLCSRRRKR